MFNHQQLQLALLSLPSLLQKQDTVSCVIVLGINMFYHQTKVVTPGSHRAHVARLVATAEVSKPEKIWFSLPHFQVAAKEYGIRLLYTEHRLFGKEEDRGDLEQVALCLYMNQSDDHGTRMQAVIVKKKEEGEGHTVTLISGKVLGGKLNQAGDWIWDEPSR